MCQTFLIEERYTFRLYDRMQIQMERRILLCTTNFMNKRKWIILTYLSYAQKCCACVQSPFKTVILWAPFMKQNLRFGLLELFRVHVFFIFYKYCKLHLYMIDKRDKNYVLNIHIVLFHKILFFEITSH